MFPETLSDTRESLRIDLLRLEHAPAADQDDAAFVALKGVLISRLANFEAERAATNCLPSPVPDAWQIPVAFTFTELEVIEDAAEDLPPHELA